MANYNDIFSLFKAIANSIRTKKGTSALINAQNFPSEINSILSPSGSLSITSNGTHDVKAYATANVNVNTQLNALTGAFNSGFDRGSTVTFNFGKTVTPKMIIVGGATNQSDWDGSGPVTMAFAGVTYTIFNSNLSSGSGSGFCKAVIPSGSGGALTIKNDYRSNGATCSVAVIY